MNILLAEDDPLNQALIEKYIHKAGYKVTIVENGQAALSELENNLYDLCIFDMQMPIMTGLEAVRIFKNNNINKTPVIMLTANTEKKSIEECFSAGADMHLDKPIVYKTLIEAIDVVCNKKKKKISVDKNSVVDMTYLESFNDKKFLDEFIKMFGESADKFIKELKDSVSNDYEGFMKSIHSIKGLSGNVGANELRTITNNASAMTEEQYMRDSLECYQDISNELLKVRKELVGYFNE